MQVFSSLEPGSISSSPVANTATCGLLNTGTLLTPTEAIRPIS